MNNRRSPAPRRGFTIIELLTTLGVIGLLAAVLIPAIQQVRETGRKVECVNHLDQIGTAVHNHVARTGRLPRSSPHYSENQLAQGSAFVYLLPDLEQRDLYQSIQEHGHRQWLTPPGSFPSAALPMSLCPSDHGSFGTNYRFNLGTSVYSFRYSRDPRAAGALTSELKRTLAEVTDGTSQTALASEALVGGGDRLRFDPRRDAWLHGAEQHASSIPTDEFIVGLCAAAEADPRPFFAFSGWFWTVPGFDHTFYNHVLAPNSERINCNGIYENYNFPGNYVYQSRLGLQKASSQHPGGVNVLFLDGAIRFVNESLDVEVWRAVGSAAANDRAHGLGD